jgi:hypothetical protein
MMIFSTLEANHQEAARPYPAQDPDAFETTSRQAVLSWRHLSE